MKNYIKISHPTTEKKLISDFDVAEYLRNYKEIENIENFLLKIALKEVSTSPLSGAIGDAVLILRSLKINQTFDSIKKSKYKVLNLKHRAVKKLVLSLPIFKTIK